MVRRFGTKPASWIARAISASVSRKCAPAADTTFSSIIRLPKSFAPKRSDTWPIFDPWVTQGSKIGQVSLRFGANDFGSLMIEENVVSAAGAHFRLTEAEIARNIQDAGFVPKRRTMDYQIVGDPYCWTHATPPLPESRASATSVAS